MKNLSEAEAVEETVYRIEQFKLRHGREALKEALNNGAFCVHPDYGDLTYIIRHRDFDYGEHEVPLWISDLFDNIATENAL